MQKPSAKHQPPLILVIITLPLLILLALVYYSIHTIETLEQNTTDVGLIRNGIVILHNQEQEFLKHPVPVFAEKYSNTLNALQKRANQLHNDLANRGDDTTHSGSLKLILAQHDVNFRQLVESQTKTDSIPKVSFNGGQHDNDQQIREALQQLEERLTTEIMRHDEITILLSVAVAAILVVVNIGLVILFIDENITYNKELSSIIPENSNGPSGKALLNTTKQPGHISDKTNSGVRRSYMRNHQRIYSARHTPHTNNNHLLT